MIMPLTWNYQTGKMENTPETDVTMGVASGRLGFRQGVRIPVVGPDGREGTIASEDAGAAFQNGWRYQTAEEVKAKTEAGIQAAKAEAYNAPATAFAAGVLRGGTLGLSDVALRVAGADTEALREIGTRSPIASAAGEITGTIAGLASGLTPAAQVAKLGIGATKAATGAIAATSKAGKIAAALGGAGVGSAIEGLAYGTGAVVSEAALGDPNLTASSAMATVGLSTLLGGGLGVVGKGASQLWNKWKSSVNNPAALMSEGYGKSVAKLFGMTGQAEKDFVQTFEKQNVNGRAEIAHYLANGDELYKRGEAAVAALDEAGKAGAAVTGDIRRGAMGDVAEEALPTKQITKTAQERYLEPSMVTVPDEAAVPALGATESFFEPTTKQVQIFEPVMRTKEWTETVKDVAASTKINKKLERVAKEIEGSEKYKTPVAADIRQVATDYAAAISKAETKGDVFQATWNARQELDGFAKPFRKGDLSYEAQNTLGKITEARNAIQEHLRDEGVYGNLAKTFQEGDEIFTRYLAAKDNFKQQFMASKFVAGAGKQKELSPGKIKSYFSKVDAESMAFKRETVNELQESVAKMQEYAAKNGYDFGVDIGKISDEIATVERLRIAELGLQRAESFTGKSLSGAVAGYALGSAAEIISDDVGAGTKGALTIAGLAAANPRMVVKYLAKLERLQNEFGNRADGALTTLLSLPRKGTIETVSAGGAVRRAALMELADELAPEGKKPSGHHDALDSLAPYINDPAALDERMVRANPHLDGVAPNTYAAMVNQSRAALQFMQEKWPAKGQSDLIFATPAQLSATERQNLEAYAVGAFRPGVLVEQLASGKIDPKTAEAVKAVHPELFEDLKRRLIEKIPESKNLSYAKKQAIGIAFGIPTTPALANIGLLQQTLKSAAVHAPETQAGPDFSRIASKEQPGSMQIASR